ncbi:MAG: antitoxin [Gemmatimonadota bacterium]
MSKRLQVVFSEKEYREIKRSAQRQGLTLSEWVRRSLAESRASEPETDAAKKLAAVRFAARHGFPTADIEQMLREIEQGYVGGS